jgi:hypothetical protein
MKGFSAIRHASKVVKGATLKSAGYDLAIGAAFGSEIKRDGLHLIQLTMRREYDEEYHFLRELTIDRPPITGNVNASIIFQCSF